MNYNKRKGSKATFDTDFENYLISPISSINKFRFRNIAIIFISGFTINKYFFYMFIQY